MTLGNWMRTYHRSSVEKWRAVVLECLCREMRHMSWYQDTPPIITDFLTSVVRAVSSGISIVRRSQNIEEGAILEGLQLVPVSLIRTKAIGHWIGSHDHIAPQRSVA